MVLFQSLLGTWVDLQFFCITLWLPQWFTAHEIGTLDPSPFKYNRGRFQVTPFKLLMSYCHVCSPS